MKFVCFVGIVGLISAEQVAKYPPGCTAPKFPDPNLCKDLQWDLGEKAKDECAPEGPYPIPGEQVYIKDAQNFCINLPNPDSPFLIENYYSKGLKPSIVQAEGYVRAFCVGDYMSPGALKLPAGGIKSAHVIVNSMNGKDYVEVSGMLDCDVLGINCKSTVPGAFDDSGQYDSVGYRQCGKEPYSGVDKKKHPKYKDYIEQAGNGIFCMRVCEAGQQRTDPCNVKDDEKGCLITMGVDPTAKPGFSFTNKLTGETKTQSSSSNIAPPPVSSSSTVATQPIASNSVPTGTSEKAEEENSSSDRTSVSHLSFVIFATSMLALASLT